MTSPAALTNGGDVPYTIENDIYYTFCPQTTGTWVVDIVPTNCVTSTGTPTNLNGYQVAIFQGTTSNLNTLMAGGDPSMDVVGPSTYSIPVTSTTACFFIQIDGFAGTVCDFGVTLTGPAGACILLANQLTTFTGNAATDFNKLKWTIADPLVSHSTEFVIERSTDALSFEEIGVMAAAEGIVEYEFADFGVQQGMYYRLKMNAIEGSNYSDVLFLDREALVPSEVFEIQAVYPQPFDNQFNIKVNTGLYSDLNVRLMNNLGQIVFQQDYSLSPKSAHNITINTEQLTAGVYSLIVSDNVTKSTRVKRILKK